MRRRFVTLDVFTSRRLAGNRLAVVLDAEGLRIEQGVEMGRPGVIELDMTIRRGALAAAGIGGEALVVSEGTVEA